jgi:hypothetical protein
MVDWDKYIEEQKFQKKFVDGTDSERIQFCKEYLKSKNALEVPSSRYVFENQKFHTYPDYNSGGRYVQVFKSAILVPNYLINRDGQKAASQAAIDCSKYLLPEIHNAGFITYRQEEDCQTDSKIFSAAIGVAKP